MKIATYNVNGVNGRLNVLLRWLEEAAPDIVCLQELKAPQDNFPLKAINDAGYNAVWHGQKQWNGVAILARNMEIEEVTRSLPGDKEDVQSRYLEALINGIVIACLYLPNGNPVPGPKFEYKLKWFDRLTERTATLLKLKIPVIIVGDFNVMPTELDVYKPEKWVNDALFKPEVRKAFAAIVEQGWTDAIRKLYPNETIYTFWDYFRNAYERNAGLRIDHFLLSPQITKILVSGGVDRHVRGWEKTSDHAPVWIKIDKKITGTMTLFSDTELFTTGHAGKKIFDLPDCELILIDNFFSKEESDSFYERILRKTKWREYEMEVYDKTYTVPRMIAWYEDKDNIGADPKGPDWTYELLKIRGRVEKETQLDFNSLLLNLYRNGKDGVGWHSDREDKSGKDPVIASVTFGETRMFKLRHKFRKDIPLVEIPLHHGSFLLMAGTTNSFWQHHVPKTARKVLPRINLTFRQTQRNT